MREIRCPNCGKTINLDETDYADILNQVRNEAFHRELHERLALAEQDKKAAVELAESKILGEMEKRAAKKDAEIERLQSSPPDAAAVMLRWVSMMPFAFPVVPDV